MSGERASSSPRPSARLDRWLVHPWLPFALAVAAVALCLPALGVGWQLDDNFHRLVLRGDALSRAGPFEVFSVLRRGTEMRQVYVDLGAFPWWTSDEFRIAFLRHLSAATAWLDFRLWPGSAPAQHAHSLLWFGLVAWAAARFYRRVHGRIAVAGLAALLFALDDAHGTAAGWLANRNALVATAFGLLALLAHDRWRRDGRRAAALLAPLCLACALAAGELAVAAFGYLLAYAVFLDSGPRRERIASLAPAAVILASWAAVYRLFGFGAAGSGLYVDPVGEPAAFLAAVAHRAPFFLAGQLTPMAADLGTLLPQTGRALAWWLALALVALLAVAFAPLVSEDRTARFWALGTACSVVPLCAGFPTNRVLFFTGLGGMALVAQWLLRPRREGASSAARALAVLLVATHLVLAPILLPLTAGIMKRFGEPVEDAILTLPDDPALGEQDLVVVHAPDYLLYVSQIPALLYLHGRPVPERLRGLAIGPSAVEITRFDERTLDVTMAGGFLGGPLGELYRKASDPLPPGDAIELPGLTATLLTATRQGKPKSVRFRFAGPLESADLRWVRFDAGRFRSFSPPPIGTTVGLAAAGGPFDLPR